MKSRSLILLLLSQIFLASCTSAGNTPADRAIDQTELNQSSIVVTYSEVTTKETTINVTSEICDTSSLITSVETLYDNSMQENYTDLCREFVHKEKVNGIAIGSDFNQVIEILGKPYEEYEAYTSEDGELQTYLFDNGHITVTFIKENDSVTVNRYSFDVETGATTESGVRLGDTRQNVIDVYGDLISVDESVWFYYYNEYDDFTITSDTINNIPCLVIGSFKYGYFNFWFDKNDKLTGISAGDITSM